MWFVRINKVSNQTRNAYTQVTYSNSLFLFKLKEIVSKTDNENFDAAAINFRTLITLEPNKGENYFFFGENYFNKGDIDSANYFYLKAVNMYNVRL